MVTGCKCCGGGKLVVQGTVQDSVDDTRLPAMIVYFDGKVVARTGDTGEFNAQVKSKNIERLTIRVVDRNANYADGVKVIDIPEGFGGPFNVEIRMVKRSEPITFNPTEGIKVDLLDRATVKIEPNSITDSKGKPYTGIVSLQLTNIDVSLPENDDILPGRFLTANGEQLVSDLVFEPVIVGENGEQLTARAEVRVRAGMLLWTLDVTNGGWLDAKAERVNRRRRQIQLTEDYLTNLMSGNWYNIDKIPGAPRCYFKARVEYQNPAEANYPASFQPSVVAFTPNNERLRLYHSPTSDPANTCFEVRCLDFDLSNPTNVLTGLISLTSYETVDVNGATIPVVNKLEPKPLTSYIPPIDAAHSSVAYAVLPNNEQVFINFISADDYSRPFYATKSICEASNPAQPAFHFLKPELPSYEAAPDGTPMCTARILLNDSYMFIDALNDLSSLPSITATSVWTTGTGDFYHTDSVTIELSPDGQSAFACITYPCSTAGAPTTVYLDIDIPWIDITNGSTTSTVAHPAFYCWGPCNGTLCPVKPQGNIMSNFEGAFVAPALAAGTSGPEWYEGENHIGCDDWNTEDPAAYTFWCNKGYRGESDFSSRRPAGAA